MSVRASIVVVGFGDEPFLEDCLASLDADAGPGDEIIVVDNGITSVAARQGGWPDRVSVLEPRRNLGFAAGVNYGVARSHGDVVVLVGGDASVLGGALSALVGSASGANPTVATGCLRLADSPDIVNSAGNPVHYLGICWSGGHGEPASRHTQGRRVASASGGFLAMQRSLWDVLGGFNEDYFAYQEDVELSVRIWLAGSQIQFVPSAVALHHYEFSRNPRKMYLLERNRLVTVFTVYPTRLLVRVLPALVTAEAGLTVLAARQGWLRQKVDGYAWLWRHRHDLRRRRRWVQSSRTNDGSDFMDLLSTRIEPGMLATPRVMKAVNFGMDVYWRIMRPTGAAGG